MTIWRKHIKSLAFHLWPNVFSLNPLKIYLEKNQIWKTFWLNQHFLKRKLQILVDLNFLIKVARHTTFFKIPKSSLVVILKITASRRTWENKENLRPNKLFYREKYKIKTIVTFNWLKRNNTKIFKWHLEKIKESWSKYLNYQ